MSIIPYNCSLFKDEDVGPLKELENFFDRLPDEALINQLDQQRKNGRNDYTNATMWRLYLLRYCYAYPSTQALIDELKRNPFLRQVCHLPIKYKANGERQLAPDNAVFTRFEKRLTSVFPMVEAIFQTLTRSLQAYLPDLGEHLSIDGKLIQSYAKRPPKTLQPDGRRDTDANYTMKTYTTTTPNGEKTSKKQSFYGYRLHLIVDAKHEIPLYYHVTPASHSEVKEGQLMIRQLPQWLKTKARYLTADRGYDSLALIRTIEQQNITPIIDIRNMWRGDQTKQYQNTDFVYDYKGNVFYVNEHKQMIKAHYQGYHKASDALRYQTHPKDGSGIKQLYIKRSTDHRLFCRVGRDSLKFKRLYNQRTASERVNGRLDRDYRFEQHQIRGIDKMTLQLTTAFIVMLGKKISTFQQRIAQAA